MKGLLCGGIIKGAIAWMCFIMFAVYIVNVLPNWKCFVDNHFGPMDDECTKQFQTTAGISIGVFLFLSFAIVLMPKSLVRQL